MIAVFYSKVGRRMEVRRNLLHGTATPFLARTLENWEEEIGKCAMLLYTGIGGVRCESGEGLAISSFRSHALSTLLPRLALRITLLRGASLPGRTAKQSLSFGTNQQVEVKSLTQFPWAVCTRRRLTQEKLRASSSSLQYPGNHAAMPSKHCVYALACLTRKAKGTCGLELAGRRRILSTQSAGKTKSANYEALTVG